MGTTAIPVTKGRPPFDSKKLDTYLENAGLDVILVSSRHNLRYLLGGYTFFFFDSFEAFGTSKYFPLMAYFRGNRKKQSISVMVWNPLNWSWISSGCMKSAPKPGVFRIR
ncbi:hypothetical protein [Erwinia sp. E_sp_W01_1]|uniref:hypothetical protein n=1 Tax=Erwinia sp. E_sp_W01_1 TaxID=3039407 RepID=UPI0030CBD0BE